MRNNCPDSALEDESEMERIRNITGRPRKPPEKEPDQLDFAFPDAA